MNRALRLRLNSVPRRGLSQLTSSHKTSNVEVPIEIPKRIPRGPTDILRALASTVKRDHTAAHYRYHDDPFLIPQTIGAVRSYSLTKDSGRKAAKYFLQKYPNSFTYDPAEPKIAAFNPPEKVFTEEADYTEDDLLYFINDFRVTDAQSVFNSLQTKGVEVSQKTILSLLELTSFYNCQEPEVTEYLDERWFTYVPQPIKSTWIDGCLAEKLFEMIKTKDTAAYSALIYGLAKHLNVEKAFALFHEMRSAEVVPSVHAYNCLLNIVLEAREGADVRWELVTSLLNDMQSAGVRPNLITFNNVLQVCSRLGTTSQGKIYTLKTLAEMRKVGIEPSLASYMSVLRAFCKNHGSVSYVLKEIVELIDEKTLVPREPRDFEFFRWAMITCHEHLVDKDLAYKLNELLEKNPDLHGSSHRLSNYFYHFFKLLASTEDIDEYMLIYNKYVPATYIPEMSIFHETLQAIDLNDAFRYVPQVWSDIIGSPVVERDLIMTAVLRLTARFKPSATPEDEKLQDQLLEVASDIRTRWNSNLERTKESFRAPMQMSAQNVGLMIQTFANAGLVDDAWISVKHLVERQHQIVGFPEVGPLRQFVQLACDAGKIDQALFCAKYSSDIGHIDVPEWMKTQADKYKFSRKTLDELSQLASSSPVAETNE